MTNNLPLFFQQTGTTLAEELANLDIGQKDELDPYYLDKDYQNEDTFNEDTFGDYKPDNLPDFFRNDHAKEGNFNILSNTSEPNTQKVVPPPPGLTSRPIPYPPPQLEVSQKIPQYAIAPGLDLSAFKANQTNAGFMPEPPSRQTSTTSSIPVHAVDTSAKIPLVQLNPYIPIHQHPNIQQQYAPRAAPSAGMPRHPGYPKHQYMNASDIRFVINKVLQPLESSDPYSDDFYFIQFNYKKNMIAREEALRDNKPPPPMLYVPLPTWKETKERIRAQIQATRRSFEDTTREWEEKEKVLGHYVRTDINRPRSKLTMPTLTIHDSFELGDENEDFSMNDLSGFKNPFSSRLWTIRHSVQTGYETLYTVQELYHLLSSPVVASNPTSVEEIKRDTDSAVGLLSQSIGIRLIPLDSLMIGLLHQVSETPPSAIQPDFTIDGGHIGTILLTTKGKKLIGRCLKILTPPHRWAILPVILARILQTNQSSGTTVNPNTAARSDVQMNASETKLFNSIKEFLQYSYQHHLEEQKRFNAETMDESNSIVGPFSKVLLMNLRQCLKSILVTQMEKSKLKQALSVNKIRAEIVYLIVRIGDNVAPLLKGNKLYDDWIQTKLAFMSMLES